jgi:phosphatidylglycerophosphate synthase
MPYTRRYNVVFASGTGITAGVAWIVGSSIDAGVVYPLQAAAFFALLVVAVVSVAGADHPFPRFGPANYVTTIRAMLAALVAGLVGRSVPPGVLWGVILVTALVAVLDGLDGWLARNTGTVSAYGARFDMETDAAFILVLSILTWQHGKAGSWVLLSGLMRYAFVAAGWVLPWLAKPLRATRRGRTVAVIQLFGLSVALAPIVSPPASDVAALISLAALVWSFGIDVAWLSRQYRTS